MTVRILLMMIVLAGGAASVAQAGLREFAKAHCLDCHDGSTHEAGLDLEKLEASLATKKNALTWEAVFDRVTKGKMPPESHAQPPPLISVHSHLINSSYRCTTPTISPLSKPPRDPSHKLKSTCIDLTTNITRSLNLQSVTINGAPSMP